MFLDAWIEANSQIEMHPYVFHAPNVQRLLKIQHKHKILTQSYAPLSPIVRDQGGPVDEVVERIAKEQDATPSQVLLAWNARYTQGCFVT
jgi:diketogulonate reductase-like aldo/keto reductase